MKTIITTLVFLISLTTFSQNKNAKTTIEVNGKCKMCKARIEKASLNTKGVKLATWNIETHQLQLIYNERKTTIDSISKNIANIGHDTENLKASDDAYNNVHECCKYREETIESDDEHDGHHH